MNDFDFIDIAENALKSLEKVSYEYPDYILETGCLPQMMNMIDFFVSNVQVTFHYYYLANLSLKKLILKIVRNCFSVVPN